MSVIQGGTNEACSDRLRPGARGQLLPDLARDIAFTGAAGETFTLVAVDGVANDITVHSYRFQKVDLASSRFLREGFSVTFGTWGTGGDEFVKPDQLATTLRFAGSGAESGDYALLYRMDTTTYGTAVRQNKICYAHGMPIYRFSEGAINLVQIGGWRGGDSASLQSQAAAVLAAYPNMRAPISFAELAGVATFESGQWLGQPSCVARTFRYTPTRALTVVPPPAPSE